MAWITIDVELSCDVCGKALEFNDKKGALEVTPCEKCITDAHTEGLTTGHEQGYEVGVSCTTAIYEGKIGDLVEEIVDARMNGDK